MSYQINERFSGEGIGAVLHLDVLDKEHFDVFM